MSSDPTPPVRRRVQKAMNQENGAVQADASAVDINKIIARYHATGQHPPVTAQQPLYGDFTGPTDLHTHLNRVSAAQEHFKALPAAVRAACDNDPVVFLEKFENRDTALLEELGLVVLDQAETPPPEPDPAPANPEPANPAPE